MGKFSKIMEKAGVEDSRNRHTRKKTLQGEGRHNRTRSSRRKQERTPVYNPEELIEKWEERLYGANYSADSLTEVFKTLRTRILLNMEKKTSAGTIMVTSAMPGEGKSFVATNLSLSFASGVDQYVLLVDGDLRRPSIQRLLGRNEEFGLSDYLQHNTPLPELIVRSRIPKLSLLLSGTPPPNPAELLSSILMKDLINELSARYTDRTIIFDAPPVLLASEARMLAHSVDGVVLVVRQGNVGKSRIEDAINAIGPERIIGIVFNDYYGTFFDDSRKYRYGYNYEYLTYSE